MIGGLFSGSFVVEVVTSWPGLGRLMFDALKARDLFLGHLVGAAVDEHGVAWAGGLFRPLDGGERRRRGAGIGVLAVGGDVKFAGMERRRGKR